MSPPSAPQAKIAILGAGPAGLTLASLLTKSSIPFTVFDLRSHPSPDIVHHPSGSLDLHAESGLLALKSCGLYPSFLELKKQCSEEMILADKDGVVRYQDDGHGSERPEIPRNSLTELLLASVPKEQIRWQCKVLSVSKAEAGKWTLNFTTNTDNTSESDADQHSEQQNEVYDLIIGADGAWSRVRPALTHERPYFSGIDCLTLTIPHLSTTHPNLSTLVGQGSYFACGDGNAIISQRGSLDSARIYLMLSSASPTHHSTTGLDLLSPPALQSHLLNPPNGIFSSWCPQHKALITAACAAEHAAGNTTTDAKPLYMLPTTHTWPHIPGLTLIGDAAHLATPFAGEGVNAAMLDALELAQALLSSGDMDEAVTSYETNMFPRAREVMEETYRNLKLIFAADAPREFVGILESYGEPVGE